MVGMSTSFPSFAISLCRLPGLYPTAFREKPQESPLVRRCKNQRRVRSTSSAAVHAAENAFIPEPRFWLPTAAAQFRGSCRQPDRLPADTFPEDLRRPDRRNSPERRKGCRQRRASCHPAFSDRRTAVRRPAPAVQNCHRRSDRYRGCSCEVRSACGNNGTRNPGRRLLLRH